MPGLAVNQFPDVLGQAIYYGSVIYIWLIILRVGLSWINPNPYSPLMRFLSRAVDPALGLARRKWPLVLGGLDFSPVLLIAGLGFLGSVIGRWLQALGLGAPAAASFFLLAASELLALLNSLIWLALVVMSIRLLMSLVRPSPYNIIVRAVFSLTEPLLAPFRRAFPPGPGGLDFRPLVFLLILLLLKFAVLGSLETALWQAIQQSQWR